MSEPLAAPFHVGLSPQGVVDAALELTREKQLFGWSIRDLAGRLDVAPSVVYHHVGGKDLIARRVVERALVGLAAPDPDLPWQDWFRTLLRDLYPIVTAHPGVAKWLVLHAPTFPAILGMIDDGIAVLQRAGFGERAGFAYAALLNTALLTVSMGDERLLDDEVGARDHATMMDEITMAAEENPGAAHLVETLIGPFARGGEEAARQRAVYFDSVVDVTIAGLAVTRA